MRVNTYTEKKEVKKGVSGVPIEWDLSDIDIDFARKEDGKLAIYGCGCSSFEDDGKTIKGSYNFEIENADVEKTFTLFLDDGKPLEVKNNKGVFVKNITGKNHVLLNFKLIVQS